MGDPAPKETERPQAGVSAAGLRTHSFRWDPFERLKLALRANDPSRRRRVIAGTAVIAALLAGATVMGAGSADRSGSVEASIAEREKRLAALDADVRSREQRLAEIERRRTAVEDELGDGAKRIAKLEARRDQLQREVAELTAPVAPSNDEANAQEAAQRSAEADAPIDDPSPPDEDRAAIDPIPVPAPRSNEPPVEHAAATPAAAAADDIEAAAEQRPASGPMRVFIHIRSSDPAARERAQAVAAELRRRGVAVAEIRGVLRPVRHDAVRFFYDADRSAVSTLQEVVRQAGSPDGSAPQPQDFRSYGAPPRPGTLELWLS